MSSPLLNERNSVFISACIYTSDTTHLFFYSQCWHIRPIVCVELVCSVGTILLASTLIKSASFGFRKWIKDALPQLTAIGRVSPSRIVQQMVVNHHARIMFFTFHYM
jgi:hypothetical protein